MAETGEEAEVLGLVEGIINIDDFLNMSAEKEFKRLLKQYRDYAKDNGFRLNPDKKVVNQLIKALLEREKKYGKRYCPCRRVKNIQKEDDKIICPCVYHKEEIKKDGHCHCFLFVK